MKLRLQLLLAATSSLAMAQGTAADFERSRGLREKLQDLSIDVPGPANWIDGTSFWYRKTVKGGVAVRSGGCGEAGEAAGLRP